MKRFILLTAVLSLFFIFANSKNTSNDEFALKKTAIQKVTSRQELIHFTDAQAKQLKEIEFKYLLELESIKNCCLCNKKKKTKEANKSRDNKLQKVLSRDQFIKYQAIDNKLIKKAPLRAAH